MVWSYIKKKMHKNPKDYKEATSAPSDDAFEKARQAEDSAGEDVLYSDTMVEEEVERKAPPPEEDREEYYEEEYEPEEEETLGGVYISDTKVRGGFKIFWMSILSLVLLPWILCFGISIVALVSLIFFPIAMSLFPIFLVGLFVLVIVAPVVLPLLIIYLLITERGKLLINSEGKWLWYSSNVPTPETPERHAPHEEESPAEEHLYTEEHLH